MGPKFDTLRKASELGLNYAAAITLPRNAALPDTVTIDGQSFPTLDGDVTDWRPGDASGQTHVVLLGSSGPQARPRNNAANSASPDPFGGPPSCQPLPSPDHATLQHRQN